MNRHQNKQNDKLLAQIAHRHENKRSDKLLTWWLGILMASILYVSNLLRGATPLIGLIIGFLVGGAAWKDGNTNLSRTLIGILFTLVISAIGSLLLWGTCEFSALQACEMNKVRANIFSNFWFPMIPILVSAIGYGISIFFNKE